MIYSICTREIFLLNMEIPSYLIDLSEDTYLDLILVLMILRIQKFVKILEKKSSLSFLRI